MNAFIFILNLWKLWKATDYIQSDDLPSIWEPKNSSIVPSICTVTLMRNIYGGHGLIGLDIQDFQSPNSNGKQINIKVGLSETQCCKIRGKNIQKNFVNCCSWNDQKNTNLKNFTFYCQINEECLNKLTEHRACCPYNTSHDLSFYVRFKEGNIKCDLISDNGLQIKSKVPIKMEDIMPCSDTRRVYIFPSDKFAIGYQMFHIQLNNFEIGTETYDDEECEPPIITEAVSLSFRCPNAFVLFHDARANVSGLFRSKHDIISGRQFMTIEDSACQIAKPTLEPALISTPEIEMFPASNSHFAAYFNCKYMYLPFINCFNRFWDNSYQENKISGLRYSYHVYILALYISFIFLPL